jgi:hypothetical protein
MAKYLNARKSQGQAQATSSKFQTPSSKEATSSKLKNRLARRLPRHLFLVFEIWNCFGAWGLALGVSLAGGLTSSVCLAIFPPL